MAKTKKDYKVKNADRIPPVHRVSNKRSAYFEFLNEAMIDPGQLKFIEAGEDDVYIVAQGLRTAASRVPEAENVTIAVRGDRVYFVYQTEDRDDIPKKREPRKDTEKDTEAPKKTPKKTPKKRPAKKKSTTD